MAASILDDAGDIRGVEHGTGQQQSSLVAEHLNRDGGPIESRTKYG